MVEIDEEFFGQKLSKKDRKIHLVYVGGVYHNDKGYFNTVDSFKKIVNQKLHIHVYSQKYEQLIILPEYKKICENEYFHIHKPIYTENLQIEISRYDWGVYVFFPDFTLLKKEFIETAYGNKISTYLEAGLPIITNRTLAFASSIIEEKGFGIVVDKPEEIAEKIKDIKIEDIDKKRKMFTLNEHIGELISFIERIK